MSTTKSKFLLAACLAIVAGPLAGAHAAKFNNIYRFPLNAKNGWVPRGRLTLGPDGSFYGTTVAGGKGRAGTVFKITPQGQLTTLYDFENSSDGEIPNSGLVLDSVGNVYGTTASGGGAGYGTVFKISPDGAETTLHTFGSDDLDGRTPSSGLISDDQGNLFGVTFSGGRINGGTIFAITPTGSETILHSFKNSEGFNPNGQLFRGEDGTLYGVAQTGEHYSSGGMVYRLNVDGSLKVLHTFQRNVTTDGADPIDGVVLLRGSLYGATYDGGLQGEGTIYSIKRDGSGETLVLSFDGADGKSPNCSLASDAAGNLYGTTAAGGANDLGVVFKLRPSGQETILHQFKGTDGSEPIGALTLDSSGNLFGTTTGYSVDGPQLTAGTIFEINSGQNER